MKLEGGFYSYSIKQALKIVKPKMKPLYEYLLEFSEKLKGKNISYGVSTVKNEL